MAGNEPGVLLWEYGTDFKALERLRRQRSGWTDVNLRKPGFAPSTVIDVGVEHGTRRLYRAFPEAFHVLVEPLRECEDSLEALVAEYGGEYLLTAVGDEEGSVTMYVDPAEHWASSMVAPAWRKPNPDVEQRAVPITTVDRLWEQHGWKGPFALKIDTEGFEHRVIRGASLLLRQTQFVIAEVSVEKRFEDSYSFAEFIALMDEHGFRLTDILDGLKTSPKGVVSYLDLLFCPERGSTSRTRS